MNRVFKQNTFISHSSNNAIIAEQLGAFLKNHKIPNDKIFCSSVLGQGINNGEKLNDTILKALKKAKIIIYILSQDSLNSDYCIEELGVGWYLSSTKQAYCFYLRLPDIELSELCGFVNSKIDKFSVLNNSDDLTLFVENICKILKITTLKPSEIASNIRSFLSAINDECNQLIAKKVEAERRENERLYRVKKLEDELTQKEQIISELNTTLKTEREQKNSKALKDELDNICKYIGRLGSIYCIDSLTIKNINNKSFWFDIIHRYKEILNNLEIEYYCYNIERLIAQIYIAYGDFKNGYVHFKYAILNAEYIYYHAIENFVKEYPLSLSEIISILKEKIQILRDGDAKDATNGCMLKLEEREAKIIAASD